MRSLAQKSELSPINATLIGCLDYSTFAPRACPPTQWGVSFCSKSWCGVRSPELSKRFYLQISGPLHLKMCSHLAIGNSSGTRERTNPLCEVKCICTETATFTRWLSSPFPLCTQQLGVSHLKAGGPQGYHGHPQPEIILPCVQMLLENWAVSKWRKSVAASNVSETLAS